jgi:hypothetical protein
MTKLTIIATWKIRAYVWRMLECTFAVCATWIKRALLLFTVLDIFHDFYHLIITGLIHK